MTQFYMPKLYISSCYIFKICKVYFYADDTVLISKNIRHHQTQR